MGAAQAIINGAACIFYVNLPRRDMAGAVRLPEARSGRCQAEEAGATQQIFAGYIRPMWDLVGGQKP